MTRILRAGLPAFLVTVAVGMVAWFMLAPYGDGPTTPLGSDTPHHIWRMRLVAAEGLDALPSFRGSHLLNANGDRPGLPVFGAFVRATGDVDASDLAFAIPAVFAATIALGAVAICRRAIEEPALAAPLYALAAGASLPVVFAANGPLEQLMASVLLLAAVAALVPATAGDRGAAAASIVLLAGSWATHWLVTAAVAAAVTASALWFALVPGAEPAPGVARRQAALRLLTVVGLAAVAAVVLSLLAPSAPQAPLGVTAEGVRDNLERQLPEYVRSPLLAAAAVGVAALAARRGRPRATLGPLLAWAALPLVGVVAAVIVDDVPVHRSLSTAVTIGVLAAAGAVGLAAVIRGHGGSVRTVLGGAVATAIVVALAAEAWGVWSTRPPSTQEKVAAQLAELGTAVGVTGRPAILVVDDAPGADKTGEGFGTIPALRRFRAALPAGSIGSSAVYLGDPSRLLAGEPTLRPEIPGYDEVSLDAWRAVEPLLEDDPAIVLLPAYVDDFGALAREHPDWVRAPWLLVAGGQLGPVAAEPPALEPPSTGRLIGWTLWALALPVLVGVGWSLVLGRGDLLGRLALAPALGLAALALVGVVAEALGARAGGVAGRILPVVVGAAGVVAAIVVALGRRGGAEVSEARSG